MDATFVKLEIDDQEMNLDRGQPEITLKARYTCQICLKIFKTNGGLQKHNKRKHGKKITGSSESRLLKLSGVGKTVYANVRKCAICAKAYKSRKDLRVHRNTNHHGMTLEGELACTFCSDIIKENFMAIHIGYKHPGNGENKSEDAETYKLTQNNCNYCPKLFKTTTIF